MSIPFSRTVNKRSGVQLNYIDDKSAIPSTSTVANNMAIAGRFPRGRIDKVFAVTRGNEARMLGDPVSLSVSALGEAYVHVYEALRKGTVQAIVSRLVSASAKLQLMVATAGTVADGTWSLIDQGAALPSGALLSLKHLECFSDGVQPEINAVTATDATGTAIATKVVTLQLRDVSSGNVILGPFTGSLDPTAVDEYQNSYYIGDIVAQNTDALQVVDVASGATVLPTCVFYGKSGSTAKFAAKALLYFTEGSTSYTTAELDAAIDRLRKSKPTFTYIGSGGTQNVALLSRLLALGKLINKQVPWDIAGSLTPAAAVTFYASIGSATDSMYSQCYWAPILAKNPCVGGMAYIGTSGQQIGLRCARNAQTNAKGIAPRNVVIAGSDYGLDRTNMSQTYDIDPDVDLELLAASQINPVIFIDYASGGKYAWYDSLTGAQTTGETKLIAVAECSSYVDDTLASAAQESLQKPMKKAVKTLTTFTAKFLKDIDSAEWLQSSAELDGASYSANIAPNSASPYDTINLNTYICYDGTNRVTVQQQTIVRT